MAKKSNSAITDDDFERIMMMLMQRNGMMPGMMNGYGMGMGMPMGGMPMYNPSGMQGLMPGMPYMQPGMMGQPVGYAGNSIDAKLLAEALNYKATKPGNEKGYGSKTDGKPAYALVNPTFIINYQLPVDNPGKANDMVNVYNDSDSFGNKGKYDGRTFDKIYAKDAGITGNKYSPYKIGNYSKYGGKGLSKSGSNYSGAAGSASSKAA